MDVALRWLLRRGLRRGVMGGDRLWLALGAAALLARMASKAFNKQPELVFSEKMGVGDTLVITHRPSRGHNGRRESPTAQPQA